MKFERGFAEVTLNTFLNATLPMGDMLTGGKVSRTGDNLGDRARAMQIACIEAAEFFGALVDAGDRVEKGTLQISDVFEIVAEAKDVKTAAKLLADPSVTVMLDGEAVTADDDAPAEEGSGDGKDPDVKDPKKKKGK